MRGKGLSVLRAKLFRMANVSVTIDSKAVSVASGSHAHGELVKLATLTTNAVPRLSIPQLNQKFSSQDNISLSGGEVLVSSLS